jgi:hypothetical protein
MSDEERLARLGLDASLVIQWSGRPQRVRKPPPPTYWEEFVATDAWYVRELVRDIPPDEWTAAVHDEDWGEKVAEDGDEASEAEDTEEDNAYSEEEDVDVCDDGTGTDADEYGMASSSGSETTDAASCGSPSPSPKRRSVAKAPKATEGDTGS